MSNTMFSTTIKQERGGTFVTTTRRAFLALGLLFSSATILPSYAAGLIDSIGASQGTANFGTGYGSSSANNANAVGYNVLNVSGFTDLFWGSAVQPDGKIVAVGAAPGLMLAMRYNINGTVDTTFVNDSIALTGVTLSNANAVTVLPNGKIVIVGSGTHGGVIKALIVQLLPTGALDTAGFGAGTGFVAQRITTTSTSDIAYAVAVDNSGNIYAVGTSVDTQTNIFVARYTSAGVLDTSYNSGNAVLGGGTPTTAAPDGIALICITGQVLAGNGAAIIPAGLTNAGNLVVVGANATTPAMLVAELNTTGVANGSFGNFNPGISITDLGGVAAPIAYGVGFQSTGKIVVAGVTNNVLPAFAAVARFTTAGVLDTTNFGTGAPSSGLGYNITNNFGGHTIIYVRGVAIQSDDKIVIGGSVSDGPPPSHLNIARYLSDGSALDTTTFASPNGYTSTFITGNDFGNSLSLQQNGSFIVAGTTNAVDVVAARYLGEQNVQGSMAYTYNPLIATNPGSPGFRIYPTMATTANKPQVKALQTLADGTLYVLSEEVGTATGSEIVQLSVTGATVATMAEIGQIGGADVIVDTQQRALIVGSLASDGWIARYLPSGGAMILDTTFNSGAVKVETTNSSSFKRVAQQSTGQIVVIGQGATSTAGLLISYTTSGVLATGATAVPFGTGVLGSQVGFITLATSTFYDVLVDSSDRIYVAYSNGTNLCLARYLANGSALDSAFGVSSSGIIDTGLAIATYNAGACLSFDDAATQNIVIAASNTAGLLSFQRYTPTATVVAGTTSIAAATSLLSTPVLTKLQCDTAGALGRLIFAGYDANSFFVGRMTLSSFTITIDPTFAPYSNYPGMLKTMYSTNDTSRVLNGMCISSYTSGVAGDSNNGAVLFGGYENIDGSNTVSLVGEAVNWTSGTVYTQVPRYPAVGTPGTIDTNFATAGFLSLIGTAAASAIPQVILPATNGTQYVAFSDGTLARYTTTNILDTTYNSTGLATPSNAGVYSMSFNANGGLLLAGTTGSAGWVEQYTTAGIPDTSFGGGDGIISLGANTVATVAVQQSTGRIVVAGQLATGNAALWGFTNAGVADATFAVGSTATGVLDTGIASTAIYAMVADQYDRLIIAYKNGSSTNLDIRRYTSSGQLDLSFNTDGTLANAMTLVDVATQVKVAINAAGNIVVAAHRSTPSIAVVAYDNVLGSSTPVIAQFAISTLTTPTLTGLVATSDGKVLVSGNQGSAGDMWVARLVNSSGTFALDTSTTVPVAGNIPFGGGDGIMTFNAGTPAAVSARNLTSIAIYGDGEITMIGTETTSASPNNNPFMARAYNTPGVTQQPLDLNAYAPGLISHAFGAGVSPNYTTNGISFYMTNYDFEGAISAVQNARAAVMQTGNANGLVVALDGEPTAPSTQSQIFINMFNIDGLLNTLFKPSTIDNAGPGQALVLSMFNNQFVTDMMTFSTPTGVSKAILAGYATNTTPALTGSLVMQYDLTAATPGLDASFGGLNGNLAGVAFGDAQKLFTIGRQSNGCIVASGVDQSGNNIGVRYTAAGKLDPTFGQGGVVVGLPGAGIYASAIDPQDRIIVAYQTAGTVYISRVLADGSGLDITFGTAGTVVTTITTALSNSNLRLVIDNDGNIAVAAVTTGAGTAIAVARYTTLGVLSGTVNTPNVGIVTAFTITKMLVDANDNLVIIGYDTVAAADDVAEVIRLTYSGGYILDPAFNAVDATTNPSGTPGYIRYEVTTSLTVQTTGGGFIHPMGSIIVGGSQS